MRHQINWKPDRFGSVAQSTTYGGHKYDSKAEANYALELDMLQKAGEVVEWEPHPTVHILAPNGKELCSYRVDFRVVYAPDRRWPDGRTEWVEVKGKPFRSGEWRLKAKLMEHLYLDGKEDEIYVVVNAQDVRGYQSRF